MISTIQTIKPDFDKVIAYSQNISNPQTDSLLEAWYEAKEHIIDKWDGKLIVEAGPVTFDLSLEEKRKRLDEFILTVENTYENDALAYFLEQVRDDFFNNRLSENYCTKGFNIAKGTKIVKAFKYFECDEKVLDELQTQASMIIQEDKINGILCMSVHPLDYLSSSENTYHWRSCHALDGDYRAGNISYMLDKSTVVCYLKKGCEVCKLPNFPDDVLWNSKKWRMLLFLEDKLEALFAGRQYPFFSPTALDLVKQLYIDSFKEGQCYWSNWYDDYILDFPRKNASYTRDCNLDNGRNVMLNGRIYPMLELVEDCNHPQHFNDLIYSSFYIPHYCWHYFPKSAKRRLHFSVGAKVPCLYCGKNYLEDEEASMICFQCEAEHGVGENKHFVYCSCCERRIHRSDAYWVDSVDGYLCEYCLETQTRECDECHEFWYNCNITYLHERQKYLCPCCKEGQKRNALPFSLDWGDDLPF